MTKPQVVSAPRGLLKEPGAEAATPSQALSGQVGFGVETPTITQATITDPIALLQVGVDSTDLNLTIHLREVEVSTKVKKIDRATVTSTLWLVKVL